MDSTTEEKKGVSKKKKDLKNLWRAWFGIELIIKNKENYIYWSMSKHVKARNLKVGGL